MGWSRARNVSSRLTFLDFALLGGFGTLVAHELVYVPTAFSRASVSHGHLPLLWALVSPLALLSVGLYVVRSLRSRPESCSVNATQLGLAMAAMFLAMEVAERLVNGLSVGALVYEGVMWAGLAVIPIISVVLRRVVSTVAETVVGWIGVPAKPIFTPVPSKYIFDQVSEIGLEQVLGYSQSRRGPPVRIVQ